ncbi:MAG: hypothetical protein KBT03_11990 [Bacteroidales bacterium]|nr:hypothetical protein [Candidatus Scybalousia scybalohippi]
MALFNKKETKEEKQARKEREMLEQYRLDELTDEKDIESVKKIVSELSGSALMETGFKMGGGTERDIQKVLLYYERGIIEQNFIMIRQLDKIAKLLEK